MFESAELGHKIDKAAYNREAPRLRADLLDAQYDVKELGEFSVIVLINGLDGAGKSETGYLLNAWMDPRHIETHAFAPATEEEAQRPPMWRYWQALPAKGKIGLFFGNWYTDPLVARARGDMSKAEMAAAIERILKFEQMLADEGVLLIKYWFHLSKQGQKARLKKLEASPKTRWRVGAHDWDLYKAYDKFVGAAEYMLHETSSGHAPWIVIDGSDERYREIAVGKHLLAAMRKHIAEAKAKPQPASGARKPRGKSAKRDAPPPLAQALDGRNLINTLDLRQALADRKYALELAKWQGRLNELSRDPRLRQHAVILVFEGNDAAGKGGAIRRITAAIDARHWSIVPVAAPTEEERAHPYLWRFWRHVPPHGRFVVFDRSWYGRVLVERVEGFCAPADWMRAYAEINDFEQQLAQHGAIILKFWLAVSADEQLKRFKDREKTRFKRFKITAEDWRNRDKWQDYETAVCDMVERTSTLVAPWSLVEANSKNFARVKVLREICEGIEAAFKAKDRTQGKRQ